MFKLILSLVFFTQFSFADSINIGIGASENYKAPVLDSSKLPPNGNSDNDVRITSDDKEIYVWDQITMSWKQVASPATATAITGLIGDIQATGPGSVIATIQPNAVSNSKLDQMPSLTVKANNTGATSNAQDVLMADLPISSATQTALNLKENTSNKSTDIVTDQASNSKYPSVKAVYDWVVSNFQAALGFTPENVANKSNDATFSSPSATTYPTTYAVKTYVSSLSGGGLPSGVIPTLANKFDFRNTKDGLFMQSYTMPAATAGAYNGGGTGNKGILGFANYNNLPFSSLANLTFRAQSIRDEFSSTLQGNVYWNLLGNFNTGVTSLATDYVNLVIDGISQHKSVDLRYYNLSSSMTTYSITATELANERMIKAVGGTECSTNLINSTGTSVGSMTGTFASGSPIVTGINNTSSIIVGQNIADNANGEWNASQRFPVDTKVLSIDSATQITMDKNATSSGTEVVSFYGGISPPDRVGTCNGTTTITVANTDDLQVNEKVSGSGVPANSYIVSKVRNTSITLNASCSLGSPTLSFLAIGKTGIPGNATACGITWAKVLANNPNGYFANTAPTVAGGWLAADGGWPKNSVQSAFNFVQGNSSTLDSRINLIESVQINSDVYSFK